MQTAARTVLIRGMLEIGRIKYRNQQLNLVSLLWLGLTRMRWSRKHLSGIIKQTIEIKVLTLLSFDY